MASNNKIAVYLNSLGPSQLSYIVINALNKLADDGKSVIAFYDELSVPCFKANFSRSQIFDGYSYDGTIVSTSIMGAAKVSTFPAPSKKLLYMWDLDWLRVPQKDYKTIYNILHEDGLDIIARNEKYKKVIEDCWNVKVKFVTDTLYDAING